jgi:hypothetical protein
MKQGLSLNAEGVVVSPEMVDDPILGLIKLFVATKRDVSGTFQADLIATWFKAYKKSIIPEFAGKHPDSLLEQLQKCGSTCQVRIPFQGLRSRVTFHISSEYCHMDELVKLDRRKLPL